MTMFNFDHLVQKALEVLDRPAVVLSASASSWGVSLLAEAITTLPGWVSTVTGYAACVTAILIMLMQTRKVTLLFMRDALRVAVLVFRIKRQSLVYRLKDLLSDIVADVDEARKNAPSPQENSANSANPKN
jgi:hypothetical protein